MKIVLKRKLSKMLMILYRKKWELPNTNVYLPHAKQKKEPKTQYHESNIMTKLVPNYSILISNWYVKRDISI
jgi:hypothetical protein